MKNILITSLVMLSAFIKADEQRGAIDALIDGLHQDAHEATSKPTLIAIALMPSFLAQIKLSVGP